VEVRLRLLVVILGEDGYIGMFLERLLERYWGVDEYGLSSFFLIFFGVTFPAGEVFGEETAFPLPESAGLTDLGASLG
jgi:hypothetical protein